MDRGCPAGHGRAQRSEVQRLSETAVSTNSLGNKAIDVVISMVLKPGKEGGVLA